MPYTPTLADRDEFYAKQGSETGSYVPTVEDRDEFLNKNSGIKDYLSQQLNEFKEAPHNLSVLGRSAAERLVKMAGGLPTEQLFKMNPLIPNALANQLSAPITQGRQTLMNQNYLTPEERNTPQAALGDFLASSIPYSLVPAANIGRLSPLLESGIGKLLGRTAYGGGTGALASAIADPEDPYAALKGALVGGSASAVLPAIGSGLTNLGPKLRNLFGATKSLDEIQQMRDIANKEGLNIPIGETIGSPFLKAAQTALTHVPLAGMKGQYSNLAEDVNDIYKGMIGENMSTHEASKMMADALKRETDIANQTKNSLYSQRNKVAEDIGLKVPVSGYSENKEALRNLIGTNDALPEEKTILDTPTLNRILSHESEVIPEISPTAAQRMAYKLSKTSDTLMRSGNEFESNKLRGLANALREDNRLAIEGSQNPELRDIHNQAQNYYINQYLPLKDPTITKFTQKGADIDTIIPSFLKSGAYERPGLLEKLTSQLNPEEKKALGSAFLTKGNDEFTPSNINTAYNKLGETQKKLLFSPENKERLDNLSKIMREAGTNIDQHTNPKTGYQGAHLTAAEKTLAALGGAGVAASKGFVAPLLGLTTLPSGLKSALMSEWLKNTFTQGMPRTARTISGRTATSLPFLPLALSQSNNKNQDSR